MNALAAIIVGTAGALLVTSGVAKLVDREGFERYLGRNPVTAPSAQFLVRSVPPAEAVVGIILLIALNITLVSLAASGLFCAYVVISAIGPERDCACGPFVPSRAPSRIVLNTLIAGGLVAVAIGQPELGRADRFLGVSIAVVAALTLQTASAALTNGKQVHQHATHGHCQ